MRPSQGFWGTGQKGIYSVEQMNNFLGEQGKKTILGNREHKKTNFRFLKKGGGGSQIISGEQWNRYPPWRASVVGRQGRGIKRGA